VRGPIFIREKHHQDENIDIHPHPRRGLYSCARNVIGCLSLLGIRCPGRGFLRMRTGLSWPMDSTRKNLPSCPRGTHSHYSIHKRSSLWIWLRRLRRWSASSPQLQASVSKSAIQKILGRTFSASQGLNTFTGGDIHDVHAVIVATANGNLGSVRKNTLFWKSPS